MNAHFRGAWADKRAGKCPSMNKICKKFNVISECKLTEKRGHSLKTPSLWTHHTGVDWRSLGPRTPSKFIGRRSDTEHALVEAQGLEEKLTNQSINPGLSKEAQDTPNAEVSTTTLSKEYNKEGGVRGSVCRR